MVIHTDFPTGNPIAQTVAEVQENLLRKYEQKLADLLEQEKLTTLCSNAGFSKNVEKGQFFIKLGDDTLDNLKGTCREYTLLRSDESSHVKRWIPGNTKFRSVLDVTVCYHQGRYGVEIMIESLLCDRTASWFCILNGINKYVTETSEEFLVASVGDRCTGKPVAKARTRPTPI